MKNLIFSLSTVFILACTQGHTNSSSKSFLTSHSVKNTAGKSTGYFKVTLNHKQLSDDEIELTAVITSLRSLKKAEAHWKLPDSMVHMEGDINSRLDFSTSATREVTLRLNRSQLADEPLFFFVFDMIDGERHGTSVSWTFPESDLQKTSGLQQKSKRTPKYFE